MSPTPTTSTKQVYQQCIIMGLFVLLWSDVAFALTNDDNLDSTGKAITFYPSSLMISYNAHPIVFFSETKLMHLVTKLRAIPPGPPLRINGNCSLAHNKFFGSLLNSIHGTQKVINRLLSLSSFSNLLECDSYLRQYFTYATGLVSRMSCPRHYQWSLAECKTWALRNCHGLSTHEKLFLSTRTRKRRSSFLCQAGLFGLLRKIYISLGHSCEPNHISDLKDTLR